MEKIYTYYQPEYVKNFQCDGKKYDARCCKKWAIFIDEKNFCPFLTEDNLCRLQKNFGEDFLSETCTNYPRCRNFSYK